MSEFTIPVGFRQSPITHQGREYHFGWVYQPDHVEKVLDRLPMPEFESAAANLRGTWKGQDVFFWEGEEAAVKGSPAEAILKACGNIRVLPSFDQGQVGSCEGNGNGRAAQDTIVSQIVSGEIEEFPGLGIAPEPPYAGSRELHNDLSRQDGSVGAWVAEWMTTVGVNAKAKVDGSDIDLSQYSAQRCKDWGLHGVPDAVKQAAKLHPIKTASLVTDVNMLADGLAGLNSCAISGQQGRTMKRKPGGWCPVQGTWSHCQCLRGVCTVKGNKPAFVYQNSWGDYLGSENNIVTLESGREITLPEGCYLSTFDEVARDLRLRDTFMFSHINGWIARKVPWLI